MYFLHEWLYNLDFRTHNYELQLRSTYPCCQQLGIYLVNWQDNELKHMQENRYHLYLTGFIPQETGVSIWDKPRKCSVMSAGLWTDHWTRKCHPLNLHIRRVISSLRFLTFAYSDDTKLLTSLVTALLLFLPVEQAAEAFKAQRLQYGPSGLYSYITLHHSHTMYSCELCGSLNKQRLFPYTAPNGVL